MAFRRFGVGAIDARDRAPGSNCSNDRLHDGRRDGPNGGADSEEPIAHFPVRPRVCSGMPYAVDMKVRADIRAHCSPFVKQS